MKIAVSYLSSNNYLECIKKINESNADFIHVDLCDGKYVNTKNFEIRDTIKLLKKSQKPLNIHLMVANPKKIIKYFKNLNVESITIHNLNNAEKILNYIKKKGYRCGIALNPNESIDLIKNYLNLIDELLIMSVMPGKGGQSFITHTLNKIDEINNIKNNYHFLTAIDGGINNETIKLLKNKDIDLVISGSYVTNSINYNEAINEIKKI
ncbi:MAG: ribulose-phosphate 3-epimerase [Bacilli bacterium]